ncbi:hypothetical protein VB780_24550 [Leptolyngbya sp. CCNP1308]|uniref:hypothetical protein n=1 Tax=Leptolyngbya sp. CCNP1308 TaxID=3110255 RepID=UPI002B1F909E|nr:hypothetical protein [Leptolyngbya sp. CCNP1308]MEA5451770.1 hypothetical protein [Leptolyngbya sp. CCNP1308]
MEALLLRAALLAGYGREAAPLAQKLAAVVQAGAARSCLDAGALVQLTVAAPGPPDLQVGLRLADPFDANALTELLPPPTLGYLAQGLDRLPPADHASMGTWLFWSETRQSVYVDLRDPDPACALKRLQCLLTPQQQDRLEQVAIPVHQGRPWAVRLEATSAGIKRVQVHWLLHRHTLVHEVAEGIAPGHWPMALEVLGHLLKRPGHSGRWVIATSLNNQNSPGLSIANSGWALVPEDAEKHRAIARLFKQLGGPQDYAEALWSLCQGQVGPKWRVGRACELHVHGNHIHTKLFFVPQPDANQV